MGLTLLRPYYLGAVNQVTKHSEAKRNKRRNSLLLFVALLTMLCIFAGFGMVFRSLAGNPLFDALIPVKIIELIFYVFSFLLLLSGTVAAVQAVYTAEKMGFFLTVPLQTLELYLTKAIEVFVETSFMFFIFGIPTVLAYYVFLDPEPGFLLASFLVALPFLIVPVGVSMLVGSIAVYFGAQLWHRGKFLLLAIAAVGLWLVFRVGQSLTAAAAEQQGGQALIRLIGLFENPSPVWMPSRWASDLVVSFLGEPIDSFFFLYGMLIISALGSLALGYLVFDFCLLRIRSSSALEHKNTSNTPIDLFRRLLVASYRAVPLDTQLKAIVIKDLSSLVRDRSQSLQLLLFLGISLAYLAVFRLTSVGLGLTTTALQAWQAFLASMNLLFVGFILTAVMTRLVYPSVSLEGRSFWVLLVSPLELKNLLKAKFWCWFPLTAFLSLSLLLLGALALELPWSAVPPIVVIGFFVAIAVTALAIGLGSSFAAFEWETPNQITVGLGTLILLLGSIGLILLLFVPTSILLALSIVPDLRGAVGEELSIVIMLASVFFITFTTSVVASSSLKRGARALVKQTAEA